MIILILLLSVLLLASAYLGYRRAVRLDHLNEKVVVNGLLIAFIVLTLMSIGHWLNLITESLAGDVTMSIFTIAAGFFIGYGVQLVRLRTKAGDIEYMYRSFWTDVAPNLIAVALFVFGVYRIGFLQWPYFTGIGITSGLSLIGFGFLGWTVRIVPEFRKNGVLMLDQFVEWKKIVAYQWVNKDTLQVDYMTESKKISEFKTYIPPEDQLIIERILGKKLKEHEDERKKIIMEEEN